MGTLLPSVAFILNLYSFYYHFFFFYIKSARVCVKLLACQRCVQSRVAVVIIAKAPARPSWPLSPSISSTIFNKNGSFLFPFFVAFCCIHIHLTANDLQRECIYSKLAKVTLVVAIHFVLFVSFSFVCLFLCRCWRLAFYIADCFGVIIGTKSVSERGNVKTLHFPILGEGECITLNVQYCFSSRY